MWRQPEPAGRPAVAGPVPHQQAVEVLDEDGDHTQQPHADGEVGLLHGRGRGGAAAALPELDVGGEELDDQGADALLQQEAELLMLGRRGRRS